MTASMIKIMLGFLTLALAGAPLQSNAKDTNTMAAAKTTAKETKSKLLPIRGKLKAVDASAKTIAVGSQTLQVNSDTLILKDGKPGTLEQGVVGELVTATYRKTEDGKLIAAKVQFGNVEKTAKAETKPRLKKE